LDRLKSFIEIGLDILDCESIALPNGLIMLEMARSLERFVDEVGNGLSVLAVARNGENLLAASTHSMGAFLSPRPAD
jgi:hypothetical protein